MFFFPPTQFKTLNLNGAISSTSRLTPGVAFRLIYSTIQIFGDGSVLQQTPKSREMNYCNNGISI